MRLEEEPCIRPDDMITFKQTGDFKKTTRYLRRVGRLSLPELLKQYAQQGVDALTMATPKDTGKTAHSWYYEIIQNKNTIKIEWKNSNIVDGVPIAVVIQYGHATRNGGYVQGVDYINPALAPIFNEISESIRKELARD